MTGTRKTNHSGHVLDVEIEARRRKGLTLATVSGVLDATTCRTRNVLTASALSKNFVPLMSPKPPAVPSVEK